MRRGPKGTPPERKKAAGTERPDRKTVIAFPGPGGAADKWRPPKRPPWLSPLAITVWNVKVSRYRARNQRVAGFEDALGAYCALEADLIERRTLIEELSAIFRDAMKDWKTSLLPLSERGDQPKCPDLPDVPASLVNAHRIWCAEFYDTPAAQKIASSAVASKNRFAANAALTRGGRRNVNAAG